MKTNYTEQLPSHALLWETREKAAHQLSPLRAVDRAIEVLSKDARDAEEGISKWSEDFMDDPLRSFYASREVVQLSARCRWSSWAVGHLMAEEGISEVHRMVDKNLLALTACAATNVLNAPAKYAAACEIEELSNIERILDHLENG